MAADVRLPLSRSALADVKLCASEVITNALVHAGGECWVNAVWTGGRLRVAVADRSRRPPSVLPATVAQASGRGLAIVQAFACSWGWEPTEFGKIVHFLVAADTVFTDDGRLTALVRTAQAQLATDTPELAATYTEVVVA